MSTHQPAFNDELDEEYNLTIDNASNTSTASDDSIESDIEEDEYPELNCRDDDKEDEEEYEVYNIRDNPKMKIFDGCVLVILRGHHLSLYVHLKLNDH